MNIRINICELSFMYQSLLQKHFFCSVVLNFTSYRFICAMYTTDDGQVLVHKVLSNCKLWQGVKTQRVCMQRWQWSTKKYDWIQEGRGLKI